jgi:probable F420-dependent oxidoreductase
VQLGVTFPQTEIGPDPDTIVRFARVAEENGYDFIAAYDHVLGADTADRPEWRGPYTLHSQFHEIFLLFAYLAAHTTIELSSNVLVLPQRQTVLVAKQAAEIDVLSGGRLRLGVGIGWNEVEYEALNEDFHTRGRRLEEQVEVLRALWTQPVVAYTGKWHTINEAGLNPLPVQRPIPVSSSGVRFAERIGFRRRSSRGLPPPMKPADFSGSAMFMVLKSAEWQP